MDTVNLPFSPRGDVKCVRGPPGRGASRAEEKGASRAEEKGAGNMAFKVFSRITRHESRPFNRVLRPSGGEKCRLESHRDGLETVAAGSGFQRTGRKDLPRDGRGRKTRRSRPGEPSGRNRHCVPDGTRGELPNQVSNGHTPRRSRRASREIKKRATRRQVINSEIVMTREKVPLQASTLTRQAAGPRRSATVDRCDARAL